MAAAGAAFTGSTTSGPVWVPIGPTGADYEQNSYSGLERDSGRARTILPDPTDANTVYLLTSGGGLWVTHNFTVSQSTWTALTDSLVTTAGGSVAFGRTPSVLYLGLGDPFGVINVGGVMVKSIDGGLTWTNTISLASAFSVRDVKVDTSGVQDIVLAATDSGLFRSTDGGLSYSSIATFQGLAVWSLVQTSAGWLVNAQPCVDASNVKKVPAEFCGSQATIYLSTDQGATWTPIQNAGNVYTGAGRTTLAVAAPGDSIAYAFAENSASTDQLDLFRSIDGGQNWTALNITSNAPTNPNTDNPNMDLMHGQSGYNQMILVDPRDAARNTIYLGGNLSSAKSTDGGNTWTLLSNWLFGNVTLPGGQPGLIPYVHADLHAAALSLAGTPTVLFGGDGGLFVSADDGATWSSDKNNGLQTFLFYSLVSTPGFPSGVIGGTQDNGTRVRKGNTTIYNEPFAGDGIGVGWSQANTDVSLATSEFNKIGVNPTNQVPDVQDNYFNTFPPLNNDAVFSTPIEMPTAIADPSGKVFFTSSGTLIDESTNAGNTFFVIGKVGFKGIPATISLRDGPHAVGVSPMDLLHVGVIAGGGHVEITSNGGTTWTDRALNTLVPGFQSFTGSLTWADNQTIYVTSVAPLPGAVRVAKSTDGGATWTRADGGLPDVPTDRVIIDPADPTHNTLLAASDLGVFRSTDGGATWAPYGSGLPNVHVSDIYMPPDGSFVRAATYGRGIWELPSLAFASSTLTANVTSCDTNGALDNGGTGLLTITLHNDGAGTLSSITATVTSTNPNVSFPNGNAIGFPTAAASADTSATIAVALNGAVGIQQIDFTVAFTDPALSIPVPVTAKASFRANYDEIPHSSANDDIGATNSPWTVGGTPQSVPDILSWERRQITPLEYRWAEVDSNVAADESLISPVMSVGSGTFSISFEQRYDFFQPFAPPAGYDGMVLEISTDGGGSWTDIGQQASPGYDQVLATGTGNVLAGRPAYTGFNAVYPNFTSVTVNLGTLYAGQNVLVRFRVGSSSQGELPGVEIRNITTAGLTNTPFTATVPHNVLCPTTTTLSSSMNPSALGSTVTVTATVADDSSAATGTVTFKDGAATLGTGTLNSSVQATFATATLAVGSHAITASYGGDATHAASTSTVLTQTVTPPVLQSIAITAPNSSIAKGTTEQFTATGTYSDASTGNITSQVSWNSAPPAVATITSAGMATGAATGTSNITATLSGVTSNTFALTVTAPTLQSIAVTPASASIAPGSTQQFAATGTLSDGTQQDLTASATWSSSLTTVATIGVNTGLATGTGVGSTNITAMQNGVTSNTAVLTVIVVLKSIAVTPTSASIALGSTQQFTATGLYSDGTVQDLTLVATWSSSPSVATIGVNTGLATGVAAGSTFITASHNGVTSNAGVLAVTVVGSGYENLAVPSQSVPHVAVDPSGNVYLAAQMPQNFSHSIFRVDKFDSSGNEVSPFPVTNLGGGTTTVATGIAADPQGNAYVTGYTDDPNLATAGAQGFVPASSPACPLNPFLLTNPCSNAFAAKINGTTGNIDYFTYLGPALPNQQLQPAIAVDRAGNAYVTGTAVPGFPTTATFGGGNSDAFVAKINGVGPTLGSISYFTYLGGSNDDAGASIAVDDAGNAYVTGLTYSPDFPVSSTAVVQPTCTQCSPPGVPSGTYPGYATAFVTKLNSSDGSITYSTYLSLPRYGYAIAVDAAGNAYLAGASNSVSKLSADASQLVYSTSLPGQTAFYPPLVGVPSGGPDFNPAIAVNAAGEAWVAGIYEDGPSLFAKLNAAGTVWVRGSADPIPPGSPLYLNAREQHRGIAVDTSGNAYVAGEFQTSGSSRQQAFLLKILDVNTPAGTNVSVSPIDPTTGLSPVSLTFGNVTQAGITTMASSTVGPTLPTGFLLGGVYYNLATTAQFAGNITICVTSSAVTPSSQLWHFASAGPVNVTSVPVIPPTICGVVPSLSPFAILQPTVTLSSIAVTPANPLIAKGLTQQFTATGNFSDGSAQDMTASATWSSSLTTIATIRGQGTGKPITAKSGSITGTASLTVTAATLQSIAVTPATASVAAGLTQQYMATGTFSDNSTQNLTGSVTWSSSNIAAATINSSGLAQALAAGTTSPPRAEASPARHHLR